MRSFPLALVAVAFAGCASYDADTRQSPSVRPQLNQSRAVAEICYNVPVWEGWIRTGDYYKPVICGGVPTASNVLIIERHTDKPIGTEMSVCASELTPAGWTRIGESYDPTTCGRYSFITNNRKQIRKIAIVGFVTRFADEFGDQCQDGARYWIALGDGSQTRLRAIPNSSAESDLRRLVNSNGARLSLNGGTQAGLNGPPCNRIDANSASVASLN